MSTRRWLTVVFFSVLLAGTGYLLGEACEQMEAACALLLDPSRLLVVLLRAVLTLGLVAVAAGLVAALFRPLWVAVLAHALFAAAMLLGWRVTVVSAGLAALSAVTGVISVVQTDADLRRRIAFSVRSVSEGQGIFVLALVVILVVSLYLGCAEHIRAEGFSAPSVYLSGIADKMAQQLASQAPLALRDRLEAEARAQVQGMLDALMAQWIKRYERLVPLGLALTLFTPLWAAARLALWASALVLRLLFGLLTSLGMAKFTVETVEAKRLVLS